MKSRVGIAGVFLCTLVLASRYSAVSAETSLTMSSEPGDFIGQGQQFSYTPLDGNFIVQRNFGNGVSVSFTTPGQDHFWYLDFAAPGNQQLLPGIYPGATRYPFQAPSEPGLYVFGDGRGCNGLTGSFDIREAVYGPTGEVQAFRAIFVQHCEGAAPAFTGEFRFNVDVDVAVRAPIEVTVEKTELVSFAVRGESTTGIVTLSATGLPPGASFVDKGDGTGSFNWLTGFDQAGTYLVVFEAESEGSTDQATTQIRVTGVSSLRLDSDPGDYIGGGRQYFFTPADGSFFADQNFHQGASLSLYAQDMSWILDFAAPFDALLAVGPYLGATRFPFQDPSQPGLSVSGDGRGCNSLVGTFDVKQVAYKPAGGIDSFWATFEQHCELAVPALRGEIRFNADVSLLVRSPAEVVAPAGHLLEIGVTAYTRQGVVALTAPELPTGATFVNHGDGGGTFRWTPTTAEVGRYAITFVADDGLGSTDSATTRIVVVQPNDEIENATVIPSLPYTDVVPSLIATRALDDPPCLIGDTIWYAYIPPGSIDLEVSNAGGSSFSFVGAFTGSPGALSEVACGFSSVRLHAVAGQTYYFMLGGFEGQRLVFSVIGGSCDDAIPCTVDSGDPVKGCSHEPDPLACADGNPCTDDSCNPTSGCVFTNDDTNNCTDSNACTADACVGGGCASSPITCADHDPCTVDSCDPSTGCRSEPLPGGSSTYYSVQSMQFLAGPTARDGDIFRAGGCGAGGSRVVLDSVFGGLGIDGLDVRHDGTVLFSVRSSGLIRHAGGAITAREENIYALDVATGVIRVVVDWRSLDIKIKDVGPLDELSDGSFAFATPPTLQGVRHAGGYTELRPRNIYRFDPATRKISLLLDGTPLGLRDIDGLDVDSLGRVSFSTSVDVVVNGVRARHENAYTLEPDGRVTLSFDGRSLGLKSLDDFALNAGAGPPRTTR